MSHAKLGNEGYNEGQPAKCEKIDLGLLEVGPDGFGVNDHFSRIPINDALHVFKHLTRQDIYKASFVSKKFHEIADHPSLDCVKWDSEWTLFIAQVENGYGFGFKTDKTDNSNPHLCDNTYEIIKSHTGEFVEKKNHKSFLIPAQNHHNLSVPHQLFTAIAGIGRFNKFRSIFFISIPLSAEFLSNLRVALKGQSMKIIYFSLMEDDIDGNTINDTMESFIDCFTECWREKGLRMCLDYSLSLLNEKFFNSFHDSAGLCMLSSMHCSSIAYKYRFEPSKTILQHLLRFITLEAPNMILNADWISELIQMYMNTISEPSQFDGRWLFAVNRQMTSADFTSLQAGYKYTLMQDRAGNEHHYIVHESDGLTARLLFKEMRVYGESNAVLRIIKVSFFARDRSKRIPNTWSDICEKHNNLCWI